MKREDRSIEDILQNFLPEERQSLAILHAVQNEYSHISADSLKAIAQYLSVPVSKIFSVATFYDAFTLKKVGEIAFKICHGTTCHANGSQKILAEIEEALGIKAGEATEDGLFSIETVNCLGACAMAPAALCGDHYFGDIKAGQGKDIVRQCTERAET